LLVLIYVNIPIRNLHMLRLMLAAGHLVPLYKIIAFDPSVNLNIKLTLFTQDVFILIG
jgi:hypothetical protein